jgi:hypothetical protein
LAADLLLPLVPRAMVYFPAFPALRRITSPA